MAQVGPVVGDIDGNVDLITRAMADASAAGAQIVALPELAITGYPPEDLLHKRAFVRANLAGLDRIAAASDDVITIVGFVDADGTDLYNAAALCQGGRVIATYRKQLLPNYGVFDEARYFEPGTDHVLVETSEGIVGVCVCEDAWSETGPLITQGDAGAQLVVNINASPFHKNKLEERMEMLCRRAKRATSSIAYVNTVGAQDELVFDGGSLVIDADGTPIARWPQFEESLAIVDVPLGAARGSHAPNVTRIRTSLRALTTEAPPPPPMTSVLPDEE